MNGFLTSNYQAITWLFIAVLIVATLGLFAWWFVSKHKNKKDVKSNLLDKRKEVLFEMIKAGKKLNDEEAAELLDINIKKAHRLLFELAKEKKVIIHKDVGQERIYKLKNN